MNWIPNPTIKEISRAITEMTSWKAPGSDGIPVDLLMQVLFATSPTEHFSQMLERE